MKQWIFAAFCEVMVLGVSDIEAARSELIARGVDASPVFHCETGTACRFFGIGARVTGPHPERLSYYSYFLSAIWMAMAGCYRK
jgi:hypothetical protein